MVAHWARPGVRVVCVSTWEPDHPAHYDLLGPERGKVYTIREVGFALNVRDKNIQLRLVEIRNPVRHYVNGTFEAAFNIARFRPLVTRTQSQDIVEHFGRFLTEPADIAPLDIPMLDEVGQ